MWHKTRPLNQNPNKPLWWSQEQDAAIIFAIYSTLQHQVCLKDENKETNIQHKKIDKGPDKSIFSKMKHDHEKDAFSTIINLDSELCM